MRRAVLLAMILAGFGSQAFADDVDVQLDNAPPIHFHSNPVVIIRQGANRPIKAGLTPLDGRKRDITCLSASGCLITAKLFVVFDGGEGLDTISAYVDGVAMNPQPNWTPGENTNTAQQSAIVQKGPHTLQSQVSQSYRGGNVTGWNVEYAVYDLK